MFREIALYKLAIVLKLCHFFLFPNATLEGFLEKYPFGELRKKKYIVY